MKNKYIAKLSIVTERPKNATNYFAQDVNNQVFTKALMNWNREKNDRKMPWKNISNPYKIWLSEIILQQTRVSQGLDYYLKFTKKYPSIHDLAKANEKEVFKDWEGLGYYNRCRNMLHTARFISNDLNGVFPNTYESILSLKGVGRYTAAALASFGFGLPCAVVDGNVIRVLSRYFGLNLSYDTSVNKKKYEELAQELLDKENPASYNQAIMDFGATICTPQLAQCAQCVFRKNCVAFTTQQVAVFPPRKVKKDLQIRHFHYLIIKDKKGVYIQQRKDKDIWEGLHEFYRVEQATRPKTFIGAKKVATGVQMLSHQKIHTYFYTLSSEKANEEWTKNMKLVPSKHLAKLAFPKSILSILKKIDYI